MGASASMMPEKMTEESVKNLCGEMYTENIFQHLKDDDGFVDRVCFLQIAMDVIEQEVFSLFTSFCPEGEMDEVTCKVFFRNAKLLAKKDFPIGKCVEMFKDHLKDGKSSLRYITLRFEMFPLIASIKDMEMEKMLLRLSRSELPVKEEIVIEGQKLIEASQTTDEFSPEEELARIKAALALQRASRPRQAKQELSRMKELKQFEIDHADYSELAVVTHTGPEEVKCEEKFKFYAKGDAPERPQSSVDMTSRDFIQLCYGTNIIPVDANVVNFTAKDARHVFSITTMKFFNKTSGAFVEGVSPGKRISYGVFRNILLPDVAKAAGKSIEDIVKMIASDEEITPLAVNTKEMPKSYSVQQSAHFENLN